jgi:Cytochrome c oxidase subunit IV
MSDERRTDAGWTLQGKLFGGVGVFILLIGLLYWFVSYEHAGSTLLALSAVLAMMTAAYVAWPRKGHAPAADADGHEPEPGHDPHDGVWFPEASIWPFAIGAGMALIANGLLLGRWLVIPASVFLAWSIAGLIRQGRHRI